MNVIGIAGSPRRGGNTELLLDSVMAGAREAGSETKTIILCDLDIHPCRHCDGCLQAGKCVVQDDMQPIYEDLVNADGIVIASPMFFMSLSAQAKAMIDRCQALWTRKYRLYLPVARNLGGERRGIFIGTGGTKYLNLFEPSLTIIKSWFSVLEVKLTGELTYREIDEKGAIKSHPTALQEAFVAGENLVRPGNKTE